MDTLCLILAIIGAINWGLVGFARFDLVAWIFGGQTAGVSRVIYAVVGIAGLWCCDVTRSVSKMTEIERRGGKRWDKPKKAEKSRDCGGGKF